MKLYSWGSNSHGQLGQNSEAEQILFPAPINFNVEPRFITGGGKHSVLLTTNDEVFTCGDNDKGQLGDSGIKIKLVNVFKHLPFPVKLAKICCGWDFNLVLTENGEVFAWGSNSFGQLGLPLKNIKYLSTPCKVFEKAVDIGAGLRHSVIVTSGGSVFTSGFGRKGQLGILINERIPSVLDKFTLVENIKNCKKVSCGECHSIAITVNEDLYSWGNNKYGQLGFNPTTVPLSATPVHVALLLQVEGFSILMSGWAHNFILTENGQLLSWGRNDFGQLGEARQLHWKPEVLKSIEKIKEISLGSHHSLALTEKGEVLTWGWNEHGNCGNECCENVHAPHKLRDFYGVKLIGSGAAHSFLFS